jgi:hypothetical protein
MPLTPRARSRHAIRASISSRRFSSSLRGARVGDSAVMTQAAGSLPTSRRPERAFDVKPRALSTAQLVGLLACTALAASLFFGALFAGLILQLVAPGR